MILNFFQQIKIYSACGFKIVLNIMYFRWMQDAGFKTE